MGALAFGVNMDFVRGLFSVALVYAVGFLIFRLGEMSGDRDAREALNFKVQNCHRIISGNFYDHK